ncbi:uncharacterized protein WM294_015207 [Sarcoramphus papa]
MWSPCARPSCKACRALVQGPHVRRVEPSCKVYGALVRGPRVRLAEPCARPSHKACEALMQGVRSLVQGPRVRHVEPRARPSHKACGALVQGVRSLVRGPRAGCAGVSASRRARAPVPSVQGPSCKGLVSAVSRLGLHKELEHRPLPWGVLGGSMGR